MSDLSKEIGHRVRLLRKHRGLTLLAVGELVGRSKGQLSRLEHGGTEWTTDTIERMARALRVPTRALLADEILDLFEPGAKPEKSP